MSKEKTVKLNIDAKDALKRLDAVEKELKGIGKAAKNTEKGTKTLSTGFKGIGLAWKAIGIGAVISALQFLAEKFSANQEIMDKVNIASAVFGDVMNQIGQVVMGVIKSIGLLGKAIGKVLKGEFSEAGEIATEAVTTLKTAVVGNNESFADLIENTKKAAKETVAYAKKVTQLNKEVKLAEANQRLLQMQYQKEAEVQRQVRDDISLTFEERIAANEKLGKILDEQFAEEKALAQKKIDLAALELSRNKDNVDLQVALINAKTEMADLDERITGQRSEQLTNLKALEKERADELDAQAKQELENQKKLEEAKQKEIEDQKKADEKAKADKLKKDAQDKKDAEALAAHKEQMTQKSVATVVGILGKESKAAKAIQVGMAIRDTYLGATKALAQGGIFGPIAAAGIIAAGMANVKKIMSTGDEESTSIDDNSTSVDTTGTQTETETVGGISGMIPNLENISGSGGDDPQPVQAFVVETDISNSQALQSELDLQATL